MPTYDYECRSCGNRVEVLHGVNATGPTACTVCGGPMRKLMSSPTIHFKGSGWAKKDRSTKTASGAKSTDSKSDDGKADDAKAGTGDGAESKTNDSKAADSKSEDKAPATTKSKSSGGSGTGD